MSALIFTRRDLTVIQNKELPCKLFLHEYLYCFKLRDSKPASRQHCLILHSNFPWPKHLYSFLTTTSCVVTAAWTNNPPTSPLPTFISCIIRCAQRWRRYWRNFQRSSTWWNFWGRQRRGLPTRWWCCRSVSAWISSHRRSDAPFKSSVWDLRWISISPTS